MTRVIPWKCRSHGPLRRSGEVQLQPIFYQWILQPIFYQWIMMETQEVYSINAKTSFFKISWDGDENVDTAEKGIVLLH